MAGRVVCTGICHDSGVARDSYFDVVNLKGYLDIRVALSHPQFHFFEVLGRLVENVPQRVY